MAEKVTRQELLRAYEVALIRWGTYSSITIDAISHDDCGEIAIHCHNKLMFQGSVKDFEKISYPMHSRIIAAKG